MKKSKFKVGLLIYTAVLLAVMVIVLFSIRKILVKYESAQGYNTVNAFCEKLEADLLFNSLDNEKDVIDYSKLSKFENKDEVLKSYIKYFAGKDTQSAISSKSFDANNPVYIVKCGEDELGEVKLKLISEKTKLGMLSIPEWKLESFTPSIASIGNSYAISIPDSFKVTFNGVELSQNEIASSKDGMVLYLVKGILLDPEVHIRNTFGEEVPFEIEKQDQSKSLFTISANYTMLSFSLPEYFTVSSEKAFTKESADGMTTYSSVFEKMPTVEEMESLFNVKDIAGDRMNFIDNNGIPAPSYFAYDMTLPKGYSVKIGSTDINYAVLEETDAPGKQYSDVTKLVKSRIYTVKPIVIDKAAENAASALLKISDINKSEASYILENGEISTLCAKLEITVPDNFGIKINGSDPDVTGVKSDIKAYADVKDYIKTPQAVTYTLENQYGPVKVQVTDNRGEEKTYYASKNISILEQTGSNEIPSFAKGAVNPLEYAKQWSYFMTDDVKGEQHGYQTIIQKIYRGSYLAKVAYKWAVGEDILLIGMHTFDNPPFSKESVTNYVAYGDNAFSCDIYFVKSFTVRSNGTHRDDVFSNRLYFVYADDTNDGVKNPHWVIAGMNEVTPDK